MHHYLKEFFKMFICKTDTIAHLRPLTRYPFCSTYEFIDNPLILYICVIDSTYMVRVNLNMCPNHCSDIFRKKNNEVEKRP